MSASLPERPNLQWLKNLAKDRHDEIHRTDPVAKLSEAQLMIAREFGFTSWRSLKSEVDRRLFQLALDEGDDAAMRQLLDDDPNLAKTPDVTWTHPSGRRIPMPALVTAACLRKNLGLVVSLVDAGLDVNRPAVFVDGRPDIMRFLIGRGMNVNAITFPENCTGLMYAAFVADVENARLLLEHRADPNIAPANCGSRALHWLPWRPEKKDPQKILEVARLLIEAGADVNARLHSGLDEEPITDEGNLYDVEHGSATPLHLAAAKNMVELVGVLLDAGADPTVRTTSRLTAKSHRTDPRRWTYEPVDGQTAADLAAAAGHEKLAQTLRSR
jgi:hypothetical protein